MRLRFGAAVRGACPTSSTAGTGEKSCFGDVLVGRREALITIAVRLFAATDRTLGACPVDKASHGRLRASGSRADTPEAHNLVVDDPRHRITSFCNHSGYKLG